MAEVQADLVLNVDQALSQVDELAAAVNEATANVVLEVSADTSEASADIDSVEGEPVLVDVSADVETAQADIESLDAEPIDVEVSADTSQAESELGGLTESLGEVSEAQGGVTQGGIGLTSTLTEGGTAGLAAATGYGAAAAGLFSLAESAGEAQQVAAITDQLIQNQGDSATVTGEHIRDLATDILQYAGFSDEAVASGANFLLQLGNIQNVAGEGNDVLDRTLKLTADFATLTNTDFVAAATALGRAVSNPEQGLARLERRLGRLPEAVRENIISLAEQGDELGSQTALLDAFEGKLEGVAETAGDTFAGKLRILKEELGELGESVGGVLVPALENAIGPATSLIGVVDDLGGALGRIPGVGGAGGIDLGDVFSPIGTGPQLAVDAIWGNLGREQLEVTPSLVASAREIAEGNDGIVGSAGEAADAIAEEGQVMKDTSDLAGTLRDSLDELFGSQQSVDEGALSIRENQRQLLEQLVELDGGYRAGTESGDAFLSTGQELASNIREQTIRLLENGATAQQATAAQDQYVGGLRRVLEQAGFTEAQIDELINTYALVPPEKVTQFSTPGGAEARATAQGLKGDIDRIPNSKTVTLGVTVGDFTTQIGNILFGLDQVADKAATININPFEAARIDPPRVRAPAGGGGVVIGDTIVNVDARGAGNPGAVGDAVAEALGPHRAMLEVRLNQRVGV